MYNFNTLAILAGLMIQVLACRSTQSTNPELSSIDPVTKLRHEDVIDFNLNLSCTTKTSQYINLGFAYSANGVVSTENVSYLYPEVKWDSKGKAYNYSYAAVVSGKFLIEKADAVRAKMNSKQIPTALTFGLTKDNSVYSDVTIVDRANLLAVSLPTDPQEPYKMAKTTQAEVISLIQRSADFNSCTVKMVSLGFRVDEALRGASAATLQDVDFLRSIIEEQKTILSQVSKTMRNSSTEKAELEAKILLLEQKIKLLQEQLNAAKK